MTSEDIIRQAVLNTINQVGCTGKKHVCWGLCEHTAKQAIPNEPLRIAANREAEIFTNRVMYHVRAIEHQLIQDRIRKETIAVDLNELDEHYKDGFETGANWKDTYIAGGPFHFSASPHESDWHKYIAMQSQAEHSAWMQGFHDGNGIPINATKANITRKE